MGRVYDTELPDGHGVEMMSQAMDVFIRSGGTFRHLCRRDKDLAGFLVGLLKGSAG